MQKSTRFAACEQCRLRKQSCDHARPVCSRCARRGRVVECDYRDRPFKKRQPMSAAQQVQENITVSQEPTGIGLESPGRAYHYPDPGYMGSSSHVAIFDRVSAQRVSDEEAPADYDTQQIHVAHMLDDTKLTEGARLIGSIISKLSVDVFKGLVTFWLDRGNNLALGAPLTKACIGSVTDALTSLSDDPASHRFLAQQLLENSARRHAFDATATFADYCEEVCRRHIRWETLVISLVSLGRASIDVPYYPSLYPVEAKQEDFQKLVVELSDTCLELALSLGCMDDLLLVSQYENWILHSVLDGDQSLNSWRRLGDVISSVLYLGYHQPRKLETSIPYFLTEMRKTSFARIYSDDKNVAVFLGRPPRLSSTFCCLQVPSQYGLYDEGSEIIGNRAASEGTNIRPPRFCSDEAITHHTSIRWAALCARLKEQALEAIHAMGPDEEKKRRVQAVSIDLAKLWTELPRHMKLEGSLQTHKHRKSFELDFLLFARLDYLQVDFLLGSSEFLHHAAGASKDYKALLNVSGEMLSIVVEAILFREHLINSGTALVWKVAHYGLPAAGIITLCLLQALPNSHHGAIPTYKMIQNLGVFVAEVYGESFIRTSNPDYALMHQAARTIERVLETLLSRAFQAPPNENMPGASAQTTTHTRINDLSWDALASGDTLGYESDFWRMLGEHPFLLAPEGVEPEPEWLFSGTEEVTGHLP